jgi:hypothetical protein
MGLKMKFLTQDKGFKLRIAAYAVKVACTVLRGERSREAPDLPGGEKDAETLLGYFSYCTSTSGSFSAW